VEYTFILEKQVNVPLLLSRSREYHVFKNCCAAVSNWVYRMDESVEISKSTHVSHHYNLNTFLTE